jgi:N-acetyl-anhydromuramyl-L-alanine amidase AmpD
MSSAHFNIDDDSIVQSVKETDIAYHAKSANRYGIGLEHAGYAKQTREQWLDSFSTRTLQRSAKLTATLCKRWNIPIVYIDRNGLKNGAKGISTHNECTFAFENGNGHTDPGKGFPMDLYIQWVQEAFEILK